MLLGLTAAALGTMMEAEHCDTAIVGAGPGGVYAAWRMIEANHSGRICMYERSHRFGGRIFSLREQGPKKDLVVDMGAYRFVDKPSHDGSWYIYTPLTAALIEDKLRLPYKPYEPGDHTNFMKKIVDAEGENAGYAVFVEKMFETIKADGRFSIRYGQELVSIDPAAHDRPLTLHFASGLAVTAGASLLNLPQLPLLKVLQRSDALLEAGGGMPVALQAPRPVDGVKLYVHYSNAWWRNLLGRSSGQFATGGGSFANASSNTQRPELFGRYHDGHTRCDGATARTKCRGFLEATYTYADNARWFLNHQPSLDPPYIELNQTSASGRFALELVHDALLRFHRDALEKASTASFNATQLVAAMRPELALLSYWGPQTTGYGGAIHGSRAGSLINVSQIGPRAMAPFGAQRVYVANEAFGALRGVDATLGSHHGWAECSLVQAENVLVRAFGLAPPAWINASLYERYVRFHSEPDELARRDGWTQG